MPNPAKSLILCVHSHQPVGNFEWVFLEAYEKSYKPFFEILEKHPSIRLTCHFSGSLIDWLVKSKPEFIQTLKRMAKRGQLEFLGGGYYEPIYGAIPKRDLIGQIGMMREKIKSLFGQYPEGVWLTERVWDPDLVKPLKASAVHYTILDDLHLERAGIQSPVTGCYQAREGKEKLDLFASMKQLRYLMPFRKAEESIEFIRSCKAGPADALVFADDCEKFGMWPGTHQWVYKERWLDKFFTLLEKEGTIALYTFSEFRKRFKPKGELEIPHASYSEMMEWSGGHFYNFFKKYPESRYMRDRMWHVSDTLEKLRSKNGASAAKLEKAKEALYRAQCNCTYWHGVFGGLYLHHLRSAVFENLIQAEEILTQAAHGSSRDKGAVIEIDKLESGERWEMRQKDIVAFFNPKYGAALEELDYIPKSVNLMCNLQRHKESYHEAVLKKVSVAAQGGQRPLSIHELLGSKEKNLERHLYYDSFRRLSLMDHFFEKEVSWNDFSKCAYTEIGNFVGTAYQADITTEEGLKEFHFERKGQLQIGGRPCPLALAKVISPAGGSALRVRYTLKNTGAEDLNFTFGIEFNFSIGETTAMKGLAEKNVREWIFNDSWRGIAIKISLNDRMSLLTAPVETVSESESGLEKTYQELGLLLQRPFHLGPKETKEHILELSVS